MAKVYCFSCKTLNEAPERFARRAECTRCGEDIQCCLNCQFYDKSSYNECRESSADVVHDKDRSNFCDYFSPSGAEYTVKDEETSQLSAAEALFKKK